MLLKQTLAFFVCLFVKLYWALLFAKVLGCVYRGPAKNLSPKIIVNKELTKQLLSFSVLVCSLHKMLFKEYG